FNRDPAGGAPHLRKLSGEPARQFAAVDLSRFHSALPAHRVGLDPLGRAEKHRQLGGSWAQRLKSTVMSVPTARPLPATAPPLLRETAGRVAILTLNRPEARNSLSEVMIAALAEALTAIAADSSVRAVVLTANGSAFCAGHDLKELTARRADRDGG